jgi:hypothetical protein
MKLADRSESSSGDSPLALRLMLDQSELLRVVGSSLWVPDATAPFGKGEA